MRGRGRGPWAGGGGVAVRTASAEQALGTGWCIGPAEELGGLGLQLTTCDI